MGFTAQPPGFRTCRTVLVRVHTIDVSSTDVLSSASPLLAPVHREQAPEPFRYRPIIHHGHRPIVHTLDCKSLLLNPGKRLSINGSLG